MELRGRFSRASDHESLPSSPVFDAASLIRRTRVSWGLKKVRNQALNPRRRDLTKKIARKPFQRADSIPIPSVRVCKEISVKEEIAVSGLLMLASQDLWKIKKSLTESDLNAQCRLLIGKISVLDHIIPYLDAYRRNKIHSKEGLSVRVKDCDTRNVFQLNLKWRSSSTTYVLLHGWTRDFVSRRRLNKDDEIGLFWSPIDNMLVFSVLHKSV